MTNGSDPALIHIETCTLCLLVPDKLGEVIGPDEVARATAAQLYGPRGWQLMALDDPRYVENVDLAIADDPTLQLVTRASGVVYARTGDPLGTLKLVRHIRLVILDDNKHAALSPLAKRGVQPSQSGDAPSPARLTSETKKGKVTRAGVRATKRTEKK